MFNRAEIALIQDCFRRGQTDVVLSGNRGAWFGGGEVCIGSHCSGWIGKTAEVSTISRGGEHAASKIPALVDASRSRRPGDGCIVV